MLKAPPIPKYLLIHTIHYKEYTGKQGTYGNPIYAEPITIMNVRVDISTGFTRSAQQKANANSLVVFVDATFSKPFISDFKSDSLITFNEVDYKLYRVVPCYHPGSNEIHHYELEVI